MGWPSAGVKSEWEYIIIIIEISPTHLCSYSSTSIYRDLDKRIDYAIGLYPSDSTLKKLEKATYNTVTKSVNQISTFFNFIPVFVNVEVKSGDRSRNTIWGLECGRV